MVTFIPSPISSQGNMYQPEAECRGVDTSFQGMMVGLIHLMLLLFQSSGVVCNHFSIFLSLDTFSILY